MNKKALLALLLALTMILSGCALIEKDMEVDRATEIIRVNDTVFTKGEIQDEVAYQLDMMAYYYSMFGMSYDVTDEATVSEAQQYVVDGLVESAVTRQKIAELGLDQLTAEELAQAEANAQAAWESNLEEIRTYNFADTELTGEELTAALIAESEAMGVTYDALLGYEQENISAQKLQDYVYAGVTLSEEELQAAYNAVVAEDESYYTATPSAYADAANSGEIVYYRPEGYRMVKQILVKFTDEDQARMDELESLIALEDDQMAAYQEQLEQVKAEAYANIDAEADDVLTQLASGADWDTLMAEKTDDPGMQGDTVTAKNGYAVSADVTNLDEPFLTAALALEKVGDVSPKTPGMYGYYIIRYVSDVPAGPVAFADVAEELRETELQTKQEAAFAEAVAQWVEAANVTIDYNALKN